MASGYWQGAERATTRGLGMGMNLLELGAQQQNRQAMLGMEREKMDVYKAQHNLEIQKAQEERDAYNKPMDIKTHPLYLSLPPESQKAGLDFFVANKLTDANGIGRTGDVLKGVGIIEKSAPLFKTIMEPVVKAKQGAVTEAWGAYQDAQVKGDEKKMAEAKARFNKAYLEYGDSLKNYDSHLKTLVGMEENEQKRQATAAQNEENRILRRELAAGKVGEQKEKNEEKKLANDKKDAMRQIDKQVAGYKQKIKSLEVEMRNIPNVKKTYKWEGEEITAPQWYQRAIDAHEQAIAQAEETKSALQNDEITPYQIQWGGGGQPKAAEVSTITSKLVGKKPGQYRVDGQIVNWDGQRVIP